MSIDINFAMGYPNLVKYLIKPKPKKKKKKK